MSPLPRRAWRAIRWIALSAAVPALWACNTRSIEAPVMTPSRTATNTYQETLNRKIDLLFMIDNSSSMKNSQNNLRDNFPRFMDVLKELRDGLPDLHIAVVSSDMGAGNDHNVGCNATGGDNGEFHFGVGANATGCTTTGLMPDQHFIASTGGASAVNNFVGDITEVFRCIAPIGDAGCGYENQLRSIVRALGADGLGAPPALNQGFLRSNAYLGIVMITNEDDCSAQNPGAFYNQMPDSNMSSRLGPPGNFRCAEFGYLCGGTRPSRTAPNGTVGETMSYDSCVSAESGELIPVSDFAAAIKKLKPDPANQILVASIQGLAPPLTNQPFTARWKAAGVTSDPPWPDIAHSCVASDDSFADQGIRIQQFVQQFGGNGLVYSICEDNFGPALNTIAQKLTQFLQPKCVTGQIARRPGSTTEECTVTDLVTDEAGRPVETRVPSCADNPDARPCWRLVAGTGDMNAGGNGCASDRHLVETVRASTPPDNLRISVSCSICIPGVADAARGCP
jgi:hypothetical protein